MKALKTEAGHGEAVELGRYIVANPRVCHGKPSFRGTRIMVHQVLADVAAGKSWDFISRVRWGGRVTEPAIAEAVELARRTMLAHEDWQAATPRQSGRRVA
jgi:uncharacterized protein (DUF433 family)